ncbi:hypothetical protein U8335_13600 [Roseiconus lacunae]|uniref:hypothetical protein n=1 Tax=Roseiconus lacunae TaxID=2605694 RepID=UPI00308D13B1|nr:hypothetical protein U8335_13600 [Stieleria sp. HD01]
MMANKSNSSMRASLMLCVIATLGCGVDPTVIPGSSAIETESLWKIERNLRFAPRSEAVNFSLQFQADDSVSVFGESGSESKVKLYATDSPWNLKDCSAISVELTNGSDEITRINASLFGAPKRPNRLNGTSCAILMPGESGAITIPFGFSPEEYDGAPCFKEIAIKPNGHRQHWNPTPRNNLTRIELEIETPAAEYAIGSILVGPAYPLKGALTPRLESVPQVDQFGQSRVLKWPGKVTSLQDLRDSSSAIHRLKKRGPGNLQSEATVSELEDGKQFFSLQKRDGMWWLLDQHGEEFWSMGVDRVGIGTPVRLWKRRELYQWIPNNPKGPFSSAFSKRNGIGFFDFYRANAIRELGRNHRAIAANRTIERLNDWGITTIGINSDPVILSQSNLAFMINAALDLSAEPLANNIPDPFSPGFMDDLDQSLSEIADIYSENRKCIGVFIGQDQRWPSDLVSRVLRKETASRKAVLSTLAEKYGTVAKLNESWGTKFGSWEAVRVTPDMISRYRESQKDSIGRESTPTAPDLVDLELLERKIANKYFSLCQSAVRRHMPNHLYLGSRISSCSKVVISECAEHADAVSLNCYDWHPSCALLPGEIDKPVLISQFHFGTLDSGTPAMGNLVAASQAQRARLCAAYLIEALSDPRIIGAHWSSYVDTVITSQPGRDDRPGLVTVADTPHEDLVNVLKSVSEATLSLRRTGKTSTLKALKDML